MTDMITVSKKEIEEIIKTDHGVSGFAYQEIQALLDKAEVVSGEAVGEIKIYWGSDTGYEYGLTLIGGALGSQKEYNEWIAKNFNGEGVFKLYTTQQPSRIAELEESNSNLKSQWMYYQDLLSLNGFDGIADCIHVNKKLQKQVTELEAEIARLNAIIDDIKVIDNVFSRDK